MLDVEIDRTLSFDEYVAFLCRKAGNNRQFRLSSEFHVFK